MKRLTKTLLLPLSLSLAMGAAALAKEPGARGQGPQHAGPMGAMFAELNLSQQQKQDIQQLFAQAREDRDIYRGDMLEQREDMQILLTQQSWNADLALQLLAGKQSQMEQSMWQKAQVQQQVWQILDDDQRETWLNTTPGKDARPMDKHREKLQEKLALSDQQLAQWQNLQAQAEADRILHHEVRKAFHEQEMALIAANNLTEESWNALMSEYREQFQQMALDRTKQHYQFYQLLDEEQRSKLKEMRHKGQKDV
ncbi:Spy/CpxP family protein refolding chaperone [Aliiglaciecola sp. CAU 1673]|uniref:Spy/CpxP family protein refolding chaperone n=1 Tax=Aliiglaciecola sp. CAU 1673 TaxID=3032595 RepID=UPI0023DB331E|nr:Spy/CpxP family protein refolding chaperone [Aliiglaciecola sp. CAU 1673]MDF2178693.1 Spy/CpxP family protein refolding chaperone [Aliiglaciecola sp. CAU 1673]